MADEKTETRKDPRAEKIAAAAERAQKAREAEMSGESPEDTEAEEERVYPSLDAMFKEEYGLSNEEEEEKEEEETEEKQGDSGDSGESDEKTPPIYLKDGKWYGKVVLEGEEREVPFDEIRGSFQMETVANRRLQSATAMQRELEQREAALREREQQLAESSEVAPSEEDLKEAKRQLFESIALGDFDSAEEYFDKVVGARKGSPDDTESAVRKVLEKERQQMEAARHERRKEEVASYHSTWKDKFKDVVDDPILYRMADENLDELIAEHPDDPMPGLMDQAAEKVREWLGSKAGKQSGMDRRRSLKQGMPTVGGGSAKRQPPEESQPKTRQQVLEEMRQSRGRLLP